MAAVNPRSFAITDLILLGYVRSMSEMLAYAGTAGEMFDFGCDLVSS